jgi:tetratricopeptide (TPR) repeat protein
MKSLYRNSFTRLAAAAGTTIVFAAPLFAQKPSAPPPPAAAATGPTCEIDNSKPQAVARATFSLARAQAAAKSGNPGKDLRDVVAALNAPGYKNENPLGRAYLLGQTYIVLLEQPDVTPVMTRSALGFQTDPTGTIDLFAAADSMWSIVEASSPACGMLAQSWRQQKPWLNVTNAAINALNANHLDSAEMLAKRALILDRNAPYAYSVLATVAKNKKDYTTASQMWKKTLEAAGTDTAFADVRERTMLDMANTAAAQMDAASPAQKKALAREGIASWNTVLANSTDDLQRMAAVQQLAKLYVAAGDSLSIGKIYAPMIAEPARYGESTLMQAGVVASQFKRPDDAALLFQAVLARNPYQRDALNNLAASYIFLGENDKVFPIVTRLVEVDPSNPDNWMLNAYAYSGLLKKTKNAKLTKQYTDSLVYYSGKADKMPVKVSFTEFSRNAEGTTLVGSIENRGTVAKTFPLSVDFLDRAGQVLFTESVSVGPVAPKGSKEFRIKSAKGGVAGYRYKPIV